MQEARLKPAFDEGKCPATMTIEFNQASQHHNVGPIAIGENFASDDDGKIDILGLVQVDTKATNGVSVFQAF